MRFSLWGKKKSLGLLVVFSACESFFLASDGSYTGAVEQIAEEQAAKSERSRIRSALQLDVLQRSLHSA